MGYFNCNKSSFDICFLLYGRHFSPDAMPLLDLDQSGLTLLSGTRKNGITRLQFKRRLISPDPQDTNLDKCQYFFLAWKGNVISRINITKQKRILVSNAKMCPMDCVSGMCLFSMLCNRLSDHCNQWLVIYMSEMLTCPSASLVQSL